MSATSDDRVAFDEVSSSPSRRRRARQDFTSAVLYVDLGADNGGIVLNLSEDGFSVQTAMPLAEQSLSSMKLTGGADGASIAAGGRIAWMSESRKTAGIQFVDVSDAARKQIAAWIAQEASPEPGNQTASDDRQQPTSRAPSAFDPGRSAGQAPAPGAEPRPYPRVEEPKEDRAARRTAKLLHLVPVEALSENGSSEQFDPRLDAAGAPVTSKRSRRALQDFEEMLRSQLRGLRRSGGSKSEAARRTDARPLLYSNAVISTIFILAALTFAAGLVAGYVLLKRPATVAAKAAASELPVARDAAPPATADDRNFASSTTNTAPLNSPVNSLDPVGAPPAASPAAPIARTAKANNFGNSFALPRSHQGQPPTPRITAELSSSHGGRDFSRISRRSLPLPAKKYGDQPAQTAERRANASGANVPDAHPPASFAPIQSQTVQITLQPANPEEGRPIQPAHPADALYAAGASGANGAAATAGMAGRVEQPTTTAAAPRQMDPCRLLQSVEPVYPREAQKHHVQGDVELRVVVGTDGTVHSVTLVSGPPLLAPAAMNAARGFRYSPALLNGHPIETIQTIDMPFRLNRAR